MAMLVESQVLLVESQHIPSVDRWNLLYKSQTHVVKINPSKKNICMNCCYNMQSNIK